MSKLSFNDLNPVTQRELKKIVKLIIKFNSKYKVATDFSTDYEVGEEFYNEIIIIQNIKVDIENERGAKASICFEIT